ncbi:MAG: heme lyase CcmF/NrfE family subunit, partial [Chloroflexi bacterium]|nr:heme lyase CcmF/NrfE family subunit [Chloroflexota bacterium]
NQYILTFDKIDQFATTSKDVLAASISITNHGEPIGLLTPEKYFPYQFDNAVSEVAIRSTLREDLYIILVSPPDADGTTAFKFIVNPLVSWIWIGGVALIAGALLAFWPSRERPVPLVTSEQKED